MSIPDRLSTALADRYRIERELGAGGMATVYLAHDVKHDRKVAIKVLKPELAAVLGADRFVVEIRTTASLQPPHVLPLFDSGTADGFLFYVMPYIKGETIREKHIGVQDAKTRKHSVLVRGVQAAYAPTGHLVYVTDEGLLMAVPFDLDKLRITGEPAAMAERVAVCGNGRVDLSISDDGVLTHTSGMVSGGIVEFVWVSREGVVTQIDRGFARAFGGRPSLSPDGTYLTTSIVVDAARSIWIRQLDHGPMSKVAPSGVRPRWTPDGKAIVFASFENVMRVPTKSSSSRTFSGT